MNGFYKHENCMDAYIRVLKVQYRGPKYTKIKVEWWVSSYCVNIREVIKVRNQDLSKWKPYDPVKREFITWG